MDVRAGAQGVKPARPIERQLKLWMQLVVCCRIAVLVME